MLSKLKMEELRVEHLPESTDYRHWLADTKRRLQDVRTKIAEKAAKESPDKAIADHNEAIRLAPEDHELYYARGEVHRHLKQWDKAIQDYGQVIKLKPDDVLAWRLRAEVHGQLQQWDKAVEDYDQVIELNPDDAVAALIRAQILMMGDRAEEYRQACPGILDRFGQSEHAGVSCHAARACVLAPEAVPDPMVPVELAARAVSRNPCYWHLYTLGMAHLRAGQLDEAVERFQESLKTDPSWKACFLNWLGLALAHHERGETEEARQSLGKAVELMEQDPGPTTQDRLEGRLLRSEAEQLLGKPDQEKQDAESEKQE